MEFLSEPSAIVAVTELVLGLILISIAADHFVEGAANVAHISKISPIIIGAVIVGFGTSAPELLVSGVAARDGEIDLGVGNIVGSNVANLSLVLGAAAIIATIKVSKRLLSKEAAISLAATVLFAVTAIRGFTKIEGVILVVALAGALTWIISTGKGSDDNLSEVEIDPDASAVKQLFRTILGLIGVVLAAQALVWGATAIAEKAGLSGGFVGLSLVAVGTSLPELVTAVVAARKGATDLIMGNLLGSNMFNSLAVGGVIALVGSGEIEDLSTAYAGIIIMTAVSAGTFGYMAWRGQFAKVAGIVLLGVWASAIAFLAVGV